MAKKLTEIEFAKLSPEERAIILEERERKAAERKKKERKERRGWILYLTCFIGIPMLVAIIASFFPSGEEKIEKFIEEYNFAEARKEVAKMEPSGGSKKERAEKRAKMEDYSQKITMAEITYFIDEGDFSKAYDSALSGGCMSHFQSSAKIRINDLMNQGEFDTAFQLASDGRCIIQYFDYVIDHMLKIYTDYGENKLVYLMSLIPYPDAMKSSLDDRWGSQDTPTTIIKRSNGKIESFCDYLKNTKDTGLIKTMLAYLKPTTVGRYGTERGLTGMHYSYDYSEVNRINAKYR